MRDDWKTLEIEEGSPKDVIRKAYKRLCLKYHPDKSADTTTTHKFIEITDAYYRLMSSQHATHQSTAKSADNGSADRMTDKLIDMLSSYARGLLEKHMPIPEPVVVNIDVSIYEIFNPVVRKCGVRVSTQAGTVVENVYIAVGRPWQSLYVFPGKGDEDTLGRRGDIHIRIHLKDLPPSFSWSIEDPDSIYVQVNLTLSEYVDGKIIMIEGIDDEIQIPDLLSRDKVGCVTNMPYKQIILTFSIIPPDG